MGDRVFHHTSGVRAKKHLLEEELHGESIPQDKRLPMDTRVHVSSDTKWGGLEAWAAER